MVALPARSWRQFTWPTVFLVAVTLAVFGIRAALHRSPATPKPPHAAPAAVTARYYRVRPGDTLTAIAAKTGTSMARLIHLNSKLHPTALFIGERIRLR